MSDHELQPNPTDESIPKDTEISGEFKDVNPQLADVLQNLPPKQREEIIQVMQTAIKQESFSGPLPHPDLLRGYDAIKSGFAERIVRMAEKEQEHRFEREKIQLDCDKKVISDAASESKRGQYFALIISVLFLIGSVVLALFGHDTIAGILGGGTLASIVTVFITGRKSSPESK